MIARLITLIAFLCFAAAAQAQVPWSSPGTVCVPSGAAVGHYQSSGVAAVRHLGAETGSIVFTCQIERFDNGNSTWALQLSYRDSTGTAASGRVLARLYSMPLGDYTPTLLATVNSNSSNVMTNNTIFSDLFTETFDFGLNIYFIQVTLTRGASTETVLLHSVAIVGAPS